MLDSAVFTKLVNKYKNYKASLQDDFKMVTKDNYKEIVGIDNYESYTNHDLLHMLYLRMFKAHSEQKQGEVMVRSDCVELSDSLLYKSNPISYTLLRKAPPSGFPEYPLYIFNCIYFTLETCGDYSRFEYPNKNDSVTLLDARNFWKIVRKYALEYLLCN